MLALTQLDLYIDLVHKGAINVPTASESAPQENNFEVDDGLLGSLADMVHTTEE